jgi:hypothetical protein
VSFDTDVIKEGRGRAIRVDVSTDNFATIAYRYGDVAGELDGTNMYSSRVLELGSIKRAFGNNRIAASSTTSLALNNADGGVDWLCGRENIATASVARFRIYVALYEAGVSPPTFTSKWLGEYTLSSWPTQDNERVELELADDFMGRLGTGLWLPTLRDWQAVGDATSNPFINAVGYPSNIAEDTPIQLAFGEDWVLAWPHLIPWQNNSSSSPYYNKVIVPLYCTTDLSAVDQNLVTRVVVDQLAFVGSITSLVEGQLVTTAASQFPQQRQRGLSRSYYDRDTETDVAVWEVEKSPTITKGGLDFQIVYLVVRNDLGDVIKNAAYRALIEPFKYQGGYQQSAVDTSVEDYVYAATVKAWYFKGVPLSQTVNPPSSALQGSHAVDVLSDLVSTYSAATVDATAADRVKRGLPYAACAGVVQPWTKASNFPASASMLPLSMRQELTLLVQSSDIDVFINWNGEVSFSADVWDFTTATQAASLLELNETELAGVSRWVASNSERGAPFNRVNYEGGRASPINGTGGVDTVPFQGPFDIDDADIPISSRVIEMVIQQGWNTWRQQRGLNPRNWRPIDGTARDRINFRTHIGGLRLELGDYFKLNWTRGSTLGGPYTSAIFQCEGITYNASDDVVEIDAIWRDDTASERQYLLDDETLLVRSKGALTGSATTGTGNDVVTFGGTINLTTMGVQPGDLLVLRDTTEAADSFARNTCLRIDTVDSATQVTCVQLVVTGGVVVNADWSIVRGKTTYPTAVSDPTNYPSGGDIYGKVTDTFGTTSDSEIGNRLISG